jgi:hypothetical protein
MNELVCTVVDLRCGGTSSTRGGVTTPVPRSDRFDGLRLPQGGCYLLDREQSRLSVGLVQPIQVRGSWFPRVCMDVRTARA